MTIDRTINLTFLNNDNRLALKITNTFDGNISYDENGNFIDAKDIKCQKQNKKVY